MNPVLDSLLVLMILTNLLLLGSSRLGSCIRIGALQGLAGGLVAWSTVLIATLLLRGPVADLAALYGIEFALHILPLADSVVLFGLAALLGWAGAWLSLTRHLRN